MQGYARSLRLIAISGKMPGPREKKQVDCLIPLFKYVAKTNGKHPSFQPVDLG
jgi:hypothetical protein